MAVPFCKFAGMLPLVTNTQAYRFYFHGFFQTNMYTAGLAVSYRIFQCGKHAFRKDRSQALV
jgi:hypothetical protein